MAIQQYRTDYRRLERRELDAWEGVAPAIVGDCMNRAQVMAARIKPLSPGIRLIGQARTVNCMVGDNAAIHVAIGLAEPGEVLVVDARAHLDTAVWGGIMTRAAMQRGLAGIVLDGALRDAAEIRELGFAAFCAGVVPAGPSKGFGGVIDGAISCGGVAVASGDLIVGDDDGVAVVPLAREAELLAASREKITQEDATNAQTAKGIMPAERMGLAKPELIG
jgi:4-hydroxy-4-methyl-2-oxoglutarate aldolase